MTAASSDPNTRAIGWATFGLALLFAIALVGAIFLQLSMFGLGLLLSAFAMALSATCVFFRVRPPSILMGALNMIGKVFISAFRSRTPQTRRQSPDRTRATTPLVQNERRALHVVTPESDP